jgi:hypothetical protein
MKRGDLRRFKGGYLGKAYAGRTFMVLREQGPVGFLRTGADILIDGRVEANLGYFWVINFSEALNETG